MESAYGAQISKGTTILVPVVLLLAIALSLLFKAVGDGAILATNYSALPTPAVFLRVTGAPPPAGISNLRVAGRSYFIKNWVWMTGSLSEQAWLKFTKSLEPLDTSGQGLDPRDRCANEYFRAVDERAVGWKSPTNLHPKEVYAVANYDEGIDWSGYVFRDPKSHIFYIHAGD